MHLIIPIIIQLYLFPIFITSENHNAVVAAEDEIQIEILNEKMVSFEFSMKYMKRRKQIQIRSEKPIESLRIRDNVDRERSYDVRGSSLIMLPKSDFYPGVYMAEVKFQKEPIVVLAKIEVMETLKPSDL